MTEKSLKRLEEGKELGGRPLKYGTPELLDEAIDNYFINGITIRKVICGPPNNRYTEMIPVPTITGLCLYLGFATKTSFYTLEKKDEFRHVVQSARTRIEKEYEEQLQAGLGAGAIFALKNFGWEDKPTTIIDQSRHTHNTLRLDLSISNEPEIVAALLGRNNGYIAEPQR